MVKARHLIALLSVGLMGLAPAAAAAAPQLYATAEPGHSVAFAADGGRASVLGFDATSYCGYVEPTEDKQPGTFHSLAAPLAMKGGPSSLTAVEDESEMQYPAQLTIDAAFAGAKLVGDYSSVATELSYHCQTGTYYPGEAKVPFEAVPFVPAGDPGAAAPSADETPIYFSRKGPLETFIRDEDGHILVRGAVTSHCKFGGAHKSRRSPLFGIPYPLGREASGAFGLRRGTNAGRVNGKVVKELTQISGKVTETGIDGRYYRRETIGEGAAARECSIGPIRFRADRYLPPAS